MSLQMSDRVGKLEAALVNVSDLKTKIDLQNGLAWELRDTDPTRSQSLSESAYQLAISDAFDGHSYLRGEIMSLRGLAHASRRAGRLALSLSQSTKALTHLEGVALPDVESDILRNTAIILGSLGNYAEGLEYGFKALKLAQSIGDRQREAAVLSSMGVIYLHSENLDESLNLFRQALQINQELGQKREEALTLNNASLAHRELGDYDSALAVSMRALQLATETRFVALQVTATGTMGEVYLAMGDYDQANQYLQKYLVAAQATDSKRDETWALILLGETDLRQGLCPSAANCLYQALTIARQVGLRSEEARCHELLADTFEQQEDLKQALTHFKLFHQVKETVFSEDMAGRVANLQILQQVETAKRDAEIHYLKTIELQREIEERKKAESALEKLAAMDPLTGVLNRRAFFVLAERQVQIALQQQTSLSTILLDIDHFKSVNDSYGHAVGDQVLAATSQIVRENLRTGEFIGRIGGDEFAILLPGSNLRQSQMVARRLKDRIVFHSFQADQGAFSISTSLGVADLVRGRDEDFGALLDHADQAMYSAKRSGRNRIDTYS